MTHTNHITWQAPQFNGQHKGAGWYTIFWLVSLLLIALAFWQQDYFGAITVSLIVVMAFLFSLHKPRQITITLSSHGVHLDNQHIPYSSLRYFWIVEDLHHRHLNFESTALVDKLITLEMEDIDSETIRQILSAYLEERPEPKHTLLHAITHKLRL